VCILEAFQNQQSMLLADKVLKHLGKEKAKDKYKVPEEHAVKQTTELTSLFMFGKIMDCVCICVY